MIQFRHRKPASLNALTDQDSGRETLMQTIDRVAEMMVTTRASFPALLDIENMPRSVQADAGTIANARRPQAVPCRCITSARCACWRTAAWKSANLNPMRVRKRLGDSLEKPSIEKLSEPHAEALKVAAGRNAAMSWR